MLRDTTLPFPIPAPPLQVLCHWALARRTADILQAVDARPAILTSALRRVLQRAPADLAWQRLAWGEGSASSSASFDAVGGDGVLYSINCQDGTVLEDGEPPGRLPREVLDHRLYRRRCGAAAGTWCMLLSWPAAAAAKHLTTLAASDCSPPSHTPTHPALPPSTPEALAPGSLR